MSDSNVTVLVVIAIVGFAIYMVVKRPSQRSLDKDIEEKEYDLKMKRLEMEEKSLEQQRNQSRPKVFKARKQ